MYSLFIFLLGIVVGIIYSIWAMPRSNYTYASLVRRREELLERQRRRLHQLDAKAAQTIIAEHHRHRINRQN